MFSHVTQGVGTVAVFAKLNMGAIECFDRLELYAICFCLFLTFQHGCFFVCFSTFFTCSTQKVFNTEGIFLHFYRILLYQGYLTCIFSLRHNTGEGLPATER